MIVLFLVTTIVLLCVCIGLLVTIFAGQAELRRLRQVEAEVKPLQEENKVLLQKTGNADWVENARQVLKESFTALASEALKSNNEQFITLSKQNIEGIINVQKGNIDTQSETIKGIVEPLKAEIGKMEAKIGELEQKREGAYRSLLDKVTELASISSSLSQTTTSLKDTLRASGSTRGKWGEITLRRIVEMAGMERYVDFTEQMAAAEGRPDMTIKLPGSGFLPVDAKAPLTAFLDAANLSEQDQVQQKLKEHAADMKKHINALAGRNYQAQFPDGHAPDFVIMLIPYEAGINAAFIADPELFDYALEKKVIVVSPATLLALLKVIAYGWMQLKMTENAREIALLGKDLLNRFNVAFGHHAKVSKAINDTVENFNKLTGSLAMTVVPQLRKFRDLDVSGDAPGELPVVDGLARNDLPSIDA